MLANCHIVGFMQKQFSNLESFIVKASYKEEETSTEGHTMFEKKSLDFFVKTFSVPSSFDFSAFLFLFVPH